MNALPAAGFLAALVLTTIWFDQLGGYDAVSDGAQVKTDVYGRLLHVVYAAIWGLLGAALLLLYAVESPHAVPECLGVIGCGLALCTGIDGVTALRKRQSLDVRHLRWLMAGIIIFGSTHLFLETTTVPTKTYSAMSCSPARLK